MNVQSTMVINWVDDNLPPLSWRITVMKLMKLLMTNGIRPAQIDDTVYFNQKIMTAIREYIKETYNKDMPEF